MAELRRVERPDLIVAAVHAGLGRPPSPENVAAEVAAVAGIDAIVFGHSHRETAGEKIGEVLLVQPRNFGGSLAQLDFTLERAPGARWRLDSRASRLLPVTDATPADPALLALARPYHELAERYLNTPVAQSPKALDGRLGRIEDNALVDAIHAVQLHYAAADVSFTALFNPRVTVPAGPSPCGRSRRCIVYDNELYAIEGTGRMVKEALENAARYFVSCAGETCGRPPLINPAVMGFNFDTAAGVDTRSILRARRQPHPQPEVEGPAARAGAETPHRHQQLPRRRQRRLFDVRRRCACCGGPRRTFASLIVRYYTERRTLPGRADGNWRIVPPEARATLEKESLSGR